MMQNPLLAYPTFSHFLDLRHQQYSSSSRPPTVATPSSVSPPPPPLFMYGHNAFRQPPSTVTPVNNDSTLSGSPSPNNAKSFTIDAILGLRDNHSAVRLDCGGAGGKYVATATDLSINSARSGVSRSNGHQQSERHQVTTVLHQGSNCGRRTSLDKSADLLTCPTSKKAGKSKRVRTIFTPEQLERLEAEFERQQYMVGPERLYLAHALQLSEAQVKVWFQNRRIKWRKQHLEMQQQRLAVIKQQQQQQHLQQQHLHGEEMDDSDLESTSGDELCCVPSNNITISSNNQQSTIE